MTGLQSHSLDTTAALNRFIRLAAVAGSSGQEQAVMDQIVTELLAAGVDRQAMRFDDAHSRSHFGGQIGNLMVDLPGSGVGPVTLLSAHVDTVPICVGSQPVVDGECVRSSDPATGLGADDRSGCAVILTAVTELLAAGAGQHPPLKLLFCVQEEVGLCGARYLDAAKLGPVDRAFNFDGGSIDKLTTGATGGQRMTIRVLGHAAHAGVAPQAGASAIVMAAEAISQLQRDGWLGRVEKPGLGAGTANVGVIQGGDATNVVTPLVTLRAEARSHDPVMRQRIVTAIEQAFTAAAAHVQTEAGQPGSVKLSSTIDYESFALAADDPSLLAAESAIGELRRTPYRAISNGGLDANWLAQHGIAAVTLGCGQQNIHTAKETLLLADYWDACRVALRLIRGVNV